MYFQSELCEVFDIDIGVDKPFPLDREGCLCTTEGLVVYPSSAYWMAVTPSHPAASHASSRTEVR